jgi:hypothetical protein
MVPAIVAVGQNGVQDPKIRKAVQRGVRYLRLEAPKTGRGRNPLAAYALLKAGVPASDPVVKDAVERVVKRLRELDGVYEPKAPQIHIYAAGVEVMLLAEADPVKYRSQIAAIANYIVSTQHPHGAWDYLDRDLGDTSISQYALLGLWAAQRSGVDIPVGVWNKAAEWHIETQKMAGGFVYHPGTTDGPESGDPSLNMTYGATGSMLIARRYLFPNAGDYGTKLPQQNARVSAGERERVLETVNLDAVVRAGLPANSSTRPTITLAQLDSAVRRGLVWLDAHFRRQVSSGHNLYYYYTLERAAALASRETFGTRDWYKECADYLLATQELDGYWDTLSGPTTGTSFALLFLTRATARTLNQTRPGAQVNRGLLAGGRGLPDNLTQITVRQGTVETRKKIGPLETLLAELETPRTSELAAVQAAIVHKVQLGEREALIGQTDRLIRLVKSPDAEVRRTALWALARSAEFDVSPVLIGALQDNNADVAVEARNALCWISRRPLGFGLPADPFDGVEEDAPEQTRIRAFGRWRERAISVWSQWYRRVRPYHERDGFDRYSLEESDER